MQEETGNRYQVAADVSFILGAPVVVFIAAILLSSSLLFAFGHPLSAYNFCLATVVTVIAVWLLCSRFKSRKWLACAGILTFLVAFFLLGTYVSGKVYDMSFDGQAYHQEGIIQLANGWNPFHDQPLQVVNGIWINHYPKGAWITSASLYILTGHIEQGKVFNIILIVSSFFLCLSALLTYYRRRLLEPFLFAALVAFNPVSILQSTTFYVDGQLASMLVIILALLLLIVISPDTWSWLLLLLGVIIAVNIKFTALAYIPALAGLPVLLYLLLARKRQPLVLIALSLAMGTAVGCLFVGFNPYVTNTVRNGNPFYPLAGPGAVDIMTTNSPANFHGMNRFEELFVSVFSRTENVYGLQSSHWKWPFTIDREELAGIWLDTRVAGFGPLFGGAVLLSLALLATAWASDKKKTLAFTGLGLLILCSALVNPEAWWARYAPQLWLLPVLCAMLGLSINSRPQKLLGLAIALVLILNLCLVSAYYFEQQYTDNAILENQLAQMRGAHLVLVSFGSDYSNRVRLAEADVHYREVARLDALNLQTLHGSDTTYKLYSTE